MTSAKRKAAPEPALNALLQVPCRNNSPNWQCADFCTILLRMADLRDNIQVVLVETRFPENIGMAARACANMGVGRLALTRPELWPKDWPHSDERSHSSAYVEKALAVATSAGRELVKNLQVFDGLDAALAGSTLSFGTTARTGGWRQDILTPAQAAELTLKHLRAGGRVSFVFGPEDRGLDNEAIEKCSHLVNIPTASEPSLNLAQAVCCSCFTSFRAPARSRWRKNRRGPAAFATRLLSPTSSPSCSWRTSKRPWLPPVSLGFAAFIFVTTEMLPVGLLPDIAASMGKTEAATGILLTVYAWMVAVLSVPFTVLTGKLNRRSLVLLLLAVFITGNIFSALAGTFILLMGARICIAMAHAVFWSIATPLAARAAPEGGKARALSIVVTGSSLATVLGVPLGTLLGHYLGWRVAFAAVAGGACCVFAIM